MFCSYSSHHNSVEQQAFCRIWRIGATQDCKVVRLVVKESIDSHMLRMQQAKSKIIREALGKGESNKRLTTTDLMRIFGHVTPKADGHAMINSDEDEDEYIVVEDEIDEGDSETEVARVPIRERCEHL